jgi:hypothetical protein
VPVHYAMKTYGGVGVQLQMSGQLHAPVALSPGKNSLYTLDRRLGRPQSQSGRQGEEKIVDATGTRTPTPPLSSP